MLKIISGALALTAVLTVSAVTASLAPDNLVSGELFSKQLSWLGAEQLWQPYQQQQFSIQDGALQLRSRSNGQINTATIPLDIEYETAKAFEISFEYRATGNCFGSLNFGHPDRRLSDGYQQFAIPVQPSWTASRQIIRRPADSFLLNLSFYCQGNGGHLELKNLQVRPVEPTPAGGKPVFLDGRKCTAIYYRPGDVAETFYHRRAAKLLRSEIYRAGGELLPVKLGNDIPETAIVIGGKTASSVRNGGFELKIANGRATIAGRRPGGTLLGAVALLK